MNRLLTHAEFCERVVAALVAAGAREGLSEREVLDGLAEIINQVSEEKNDGTR